jgi:hypothetical protein
MYLYQYMLSVKLSKVLSQIIINCYTSFWIWNGSTDMSFVAVCQPIINMKVRQPDTCYSLCWFHLMLTEACDYELHVFVHADEYEYTYIYTYVHS